MIPLPDDFDRSRAAAAIDARWQQVPAQALATALASVSYPLYAKFLSVASKTRPASEVFSADSLRAALQAGDPAAFDVAAETLGRVLPPDAVVELAKALLGAKPWKRLRNLAFEMAARLSTEESFRFLLSEPLASHFYGKSGFAGAEALAYERLAASPFYDLALAPATRTAVAQRSKEEAEAEAAHRKSIVEALAPMEARVVQDLITFLLARGSERGRRAARRFVENSHPDGGLRSRAAGGLVDGGHRDDLEFMTRYLDDADSAIRQDAIRAVLMLDPKRAWERLCGDRLMQPGAEGDTEELLYVLGRDLAGVGGAPVRGWAKEDSRFVELARKWLPNKKMKQPIFVLHGLGEQV